MNITIKAGEKEIAATLQDNAAARDFVARLPLTLTLEDYGDTEKISPLPGKLSTAGSPAMGKPFRGGHRLLRPVGQFVHFQEGLRAVPRPGDSGERGRGRDEGAGCFRKDPRDH